MTTNDTTARLAAALAALVACAGLPATWSPTRACPLCPLPAVARDDSSGSLEDAASFTCR